MRGLLTFLSHPLRNISEGGVPTVDLIICTCQLIFNGNIAILKPTSLRHNMCVCVYIYVYTLWSIGCKYWYKDRSANCVLNNIHHIN